MLESIANFVGRFYAFYFQILVLDGRGVTSISEDIGELLIKRGDTHKFMTSDSLPLFYENV